MRNARWCPHDMPDACPPGAFNIPQSLVSGSESAVVWTF
jgi:hypothetical protein